MTLPGFSKTMTIFLHLFLMAAAKDASGCPNCEYLYRKLGPTVHPPTDCCGECKDGYERLNIWYPDDYKYRCRRVPITELETPPSQNESSTPATTQISTSSPTTPSSTILLTSQNITEYTENTTLYTNTTLTANVGLKTGDIMAIVCSLFVLLVLTSLLAYFFIRRKKQMHRGSKNAVRFVTNGNGKHPDSPGSKKNHNRSRPGQLVDEDDDDASRLLDQTKPGNSNGQVPRIDESSKEDSNNNKRELQDVGVHSVIVHQEGSHEYDAVPFTSPAVTQNNEFLPFRRQSSGRHNPFDRERESFSDDPEECTLSLLKDANNAHPDLFLDSEDKRDKDGGSSAGSSGGSSTGSTPACTPGSGNTVNIFQLHQSFKISGISGPTVYK